MAANAANLTQILNFKVNFHQEFELYSKIKIYANIGRHFKIVCITKNIKFVHITYVISLIVRPYNFNK